MSPATIPPNIQGSPQQARETKLFSTIAIAMLAWALLPFNPYGYYIVLRWVVALVGIYFAIGARRVGRPGWTASLILMSILYNPISRVPLERTSWMAVNILTIALLVAYRRREMYA